ncbi:hypothetical protein [Roseobacter cerasinus]|nr:hypothetical protein [Roseobacter cerasinus]
MTWVRIGAWRLRQGQHGDAMVWETLKQLKDQHRNPLAHPNVTVSLEEAIGVIGVAYDVIHEMLRAMPDASETATD